MKHQAALILALALVVSASVCCTRATPEPTAAPTAIPPAPTARPSPLTIEALKNAEYATDSAAQGKVRLSNGLYEEQAAPGSAAKTTIRLHDLYAIGDLNGDLVDDAAAVLVANTGGSGTFFQLAGVLNQGGAPVHVASADLGDRVKLEYLRIASGMITVRMITQGPADPMCCPTQPVTRTYALAGNKLELVKTEQDAPTPTPQPTAAATKTPSPLANSHWTLIAMGGGMSQTAALPNTEVTLRLGPDGKATGSAGCNTFGGSYEISGSKLQFGPLAATKMYCGDNGRMQQETNYFAVLGSTHSYRIVMGQLLLLDQQGTQVAQFQTMITANEPVTRIITIDSPVEGVQVSSPVAVRGSVTVSPFESTLTYHVVDASGKLLGAGPVMVDAEMGTPGAFSGLLQFEAATPGPGRIEILELSARDGSEMAKATVNVVFE
jgi:heat shock protein HslJ